MLEKAQAAALAKTRKAAAGPEAKPVYSRMLRPVAPQPQAPASAVNDDFFANLLRGLEGPPAPSSSHAHAEVPRAATAIAAPAVNPVIPNGLGSGSNEAQGSSVENAVENVVQEEENAAGNHTGGDEVNADDQFLDDLLGGLGLQK